MSRSQTLISDCREHIQAVGAIVSPTFRVTIALVFTIFVWRTHVSPLKRLKYDHHDSCSFSYGSHVRHRKDKGRYCSTLLTDDSYTLWYIVTYGSSFRILQSSNCNDGGTIRSG